tara:strand:- start:107 stop:688 length:582 start_codon:yes stop_codon:yes gene_type:complete
MFYLTCNRVGYKLLDPHIWEVFGGKYNTESLGFTKHISKTKKFKECKPPAYTQVDDSRGFAVDLPKGSKVIIDPFPPGLQGPEVNEISDTKEEQIEDLWDKVKTQEAEIGGLEVEIQQLNIKLKHQKPSGSIRWKLTYTWCYGTEVHWDFKTKKQAVAFMEENIKDFFGVKIVESIRDIKYNKYIYGQKVKQE